MNEEEDDLPPMHRLLNAFQDAVERETRAQSACRQAQESARRAQEYWVSCTEETTKTRVALEELIQGESPPRDLFSSGVVHEPWSTANSKRRAMMANDHHDRCWYCGCELALHAEHYELHESGTQYVRLSRFAEAVIEHQEPRSRGGHSGWDNLVTACFTCNTRKRNRNVEEFRAWVISKTGAGIVFYGEAPGISGSGFSLPLISDELVNRRLQRLAEKRKTT